MPRQYSVRNFQMRAFTVGIGGSAESGRPMLLLALCRLLRDNYSIAFVVGPPGAGEDGVREFLIRHKAITPSRIALVDHSGHANPAIEWLMRESRPELLFVDGHRHGETTIAPDFTIHVVNGSGSGLSPDDVIGASTADLLVLNKTHIGPPLDRERHVAVREALHARGAAPSVVADLRYGIGTIDVAKQFLGRWRQVSAPAASAVPLAGRAVLAQV